MIYETLAFISATESQKFLKKKEIINFSTYRRICILQAPVKHGNESWISINCKDFID
jgi:hypothetical protein